VKALLVALVLLVACGEPADYRRAPPLPPISIDAQLPAPPPTPPGVGTATRQAVRLMSFVQETETLPPPVEVEDGPGWARCPQWWSEARSVGWREGDLARMDSIMWRESRCQPGAHNRDGANGLLQVMAMWADDCGIAVAQLLQAIPNLACALHVLQVQGWAAWAT
jgi:hypothetical protein